MPTGGISLDNLEEYLQADCVIACGGSFMVKEQLISENRWEEITEISKKATEIAERVRGEK